MGLGSLVRGAMEAVRAATESLGFQADVSVEGWTSQSGQGEPEYAEAVAHPALVVEGQQQRLTSDGRTVTVKACVVFLPASTSEMPPAIDRRDRITLPSGLTGPIVDLTTAAVDPLSGQPYMRVAWLG